MKKFLISACLCALFSMPSKAKVITTNEVVFASAPPWLSEGMVEAAVGRVQNFLEWDLHKIQASLYTSDEAFKNKSHLNFSAEAFFDRTTSTIHLGPSVNKDNFDRVFGHELVHAVFSQKYQGAIPSWLEEGLANYIGKKSSPDYKWLANQPLGDVTLLKHPNQDSSGAHFHYAVSTGLIEMIASRCALHDLLQLSVGMNITKYLSTFCEIKDLNSDFAAWVKKQAKEVGTPESGTVPQTGSDDIPFWKKKPQKQWWEKDSPREQQN